MLLEKNNFKIDSSNWEIISVDGGEPYLNTEIKIKLNPERDIIEYVSGLPNRMLGEQLFTYNAAIRETVKNNKKIPTIEKFKSIVDIEDSEGIRFIFLDPSNKDRIKWYNFEDGINLKSLGICSFFEGKYLFGNIDNFDYRWLGNENVVALRSDMYAFGDVSGFLGPDGSTGFCSVRCLK
ncbi:MAG: hypothetical protein M0P94_01025 [Candidatus Absconditabacterales bacterium]|nr:hypothetical protein [Candidatus Absconditabacterales bacterium]